MQLFEEEGSLIENAEKRAEVSKQLKGILKRRTAIEKKVNGYIEGWETAIDRLDAATTGADAEENKSKLQGYIRKANQYIRKLQTIEDTQYKNSKLFIDLYKEIDKSIKKDIEKVNVAVRAATNFSTLAIATGAWEGLKRFIIAIGETDAARAFFNLVPELRSTIRDRIGKITRMQEAMQGAETTEAENEAHIINDLMKLEEKIERINRPRGQPDIGEDPAEVNRP